MRSILSRAIAFGSTSCPCCQRPAATWEAATATQAAKAAFRLSLRGEDPAFDLTSLTRESLGRRINLLSPQDSLIVLKPAGQLAHEGGARFAFDSPEASSLIHWIAAGGKDDLTTAPRVVRLDVFPGDRINAAPCLAQQLVVTAEFSDASRRDVTRQATYDVSDPTKVSVTSDGRVESAGPREVAIAIRYLGERRVSRLTFLTDRPGFVWRAPEPSNLVDRHVFTKLKLLKINPSEAVSDPVFLRRSALDAIGCLPTPEEAREFLADPDPAKRYRRVDALLARPEFADFWALKWADLLRNEEKTMGEKGVWIFQRWLRDQFAADVPLTEFASRLVTAKGSTFSTPAASFYRTNRDPMTAAETVGQVFLGVRIQCARCHNHPFDVWTQDDYYGLAAYFANVRQKEVNVQRKDKLDKHEINGDEVIYLEGLAQIAHPRSGEMMAPRPLQMPEKRSGSLADARGDLARWLTENNRQFARNIVNRAWYHLMGRGIVEPVDDFRESNPPANPMLLEALSDEFIKGGYRLKPIVALILKSQTYQLSAQTNETNAADESNFAHASIRMLPAEVLLDALSSALGAPRRVSGSPAGIRATQLPGARMGGTFLKVFGKPDRLLTCECERSEATTLSQAFQLINGDAVREMIEAKENRLTRLLDSGASDDAILESLTLATLGRAPTSSEAAGFRSHLRNASNRRRAWEDVTWTLINSKEFLLRH